MDLESTVNEMTANLLRFCIGISGDSAEGEEIAQEALTSLVRYWRRNGPPDSPRAFTYTVARRQAGRSRWRKKFFRPLEALRGHPESQSNPEGDLMSRGGIWAVLAALEELSPRDRQAIMLAVPEDLEVKEAARILGISVSAFKMRVHRARRRLSHRMENHHETR